MYIDFKKLYTVKILDGKEIKNLQIKAYSRASVPMLVHKIHPGVYIIGARILKR